VQIAVEYSKLREMCLTVLRREFRLVQFRLLYPNSADFAQSPVSNIFLPNKTGGIEFDDILGSIYSHDNVSLEKSTYIPLLDLCTDMKTAMLV